jgi:hypothetical protein
LSVATLAMFGHAHDRAGEGVLADAGLADAGLADVGLAGADDEHAPIPAVSATQRPSTPTRLANDRIPVHLPYPAGSTSPSQKLISLNKKVISLIWSCRQTAPARRPAAAGWLI